MDTNAGMGGSYLRQADGSLKLVGRTEPTQKPTEEKQAKSPAARKEPSNG